MNHTSRTWRSLFGWLVFVCALAAGGTAAAQAQSKDFDHLRTGFALTGVHATTRCESCHVNGLFKGTPRDCESCHVTGARLARNNIVKSSNHIPTQLACDTCHNTRVFTGARMVHGQVARGTCNSCHNGAQASGKYADHVRTTASCDSCHTTTAWRPVTNFDHSSVAAGTCDSCHNGSRATGKSTRHTPYTQVATIAGSACDSCHRGGYTSWTPAKLHTSVSVIGQCATCHASAKTNTAVHAGQTVCETCHSSTSTWTGAKVDHNTFTAATNCAGCHTGNGATGKSGTHIPVGATNCVSCHNVRTWKPTTFNHTQVAASGQCASCHNGNYAGASGKKASHTPYTLVASIASNNCDSCHKAGFSSWTPVKLHSGVSVSTQCATCHASAKPADATHTGQTVCENCHKGTSTWTGAKVDHNTFTAATNCASCHNGNGVTGKSSTHIPVGATNCITCHNVNTWKPSKFNHTQVPVTAQCASCHTGAFPPADGKSASHTPYQLIAAAASANCDTCHKSGFTSWTPAKLHLNVTATTQCATCHAALKPNTATHTGQTVCENCHTNTSNWATAKVDHNTFTAATNCASCHNGNGVTGKSSTHIPVGATNCITCHSVTTWKPTKFNHTQVPVTAQCASCHSGAFPPADGKSASHTPYQLVAAAAAANCDTCHKSGFTSWTPAKLHLNVTATTQCATCHAALKPNTATHTGQTVCENCHTNTSNWATAKVDHNTFTAATNCASCHNGNGVTGKSSTHIPVGATNCITCHSVTTWKPTKFNHTQVPVTAQCASCHSGAFPPADGKSASHTPYQLVAAAAAANCDTCHKSGFSSWTPARLHLNVTVLTQCATCHAAIKPNTATHTGQTVCENCHTNTSNWATAKVDHNTFTAATNCASCHNGNGVTGKSSTHIPVGATNCITCHNVSTWKPTKFNHTQVPVTAQCASCHSGAFPPADGKSASHTPYQLIAAAAAANCDTCHKSGFSSWLPAKLHLNVTVVTQCATCHANTKPNTAVHVGQTVCENCHKSTSTWTGAKVDHNTFTAATNCASCHNGSTATPKSATHIPVGATNCISCHTVTSWRPTKFNHTQVPVTAQCATCHSGAFPPADGKNATHIPYQLIATAASANCDTCHKGGFASWANGRLHANVTVSGQCKTCHNGSYTSQGADTKPANHIPEAQLLNGASMECNACHTSTTTWTQRMNHNNSLGGGAGWCKACHASGTAFLGSMEKKSLTHEVKNTTATDCSASGCHRPLGNKGAAYTKWD